jgi:hypothetical protein
VIIYHHRSLRMVRPRTQSAVEMCAAYLILDSVAALATTSRRAPRYWRVSGKILDRGRSIQTVPRALPGALVGSGFGFGWGFGRRIFRYRPCFTLPSDRAIVWEWLLSCRVCLMFTSSRNLKSTE